MFQTVITTQICLYHLNQFVDDNDDDDDDDDDVVVVVVVVVVYRSGEGIHAIIDRECELYEF